MRQGSIPNRAAVDTGGGPPNNGEMEHRLTALETKLETILPTLATRGDVSEAKSAIVMWMSGVVFAAAALTVSVLLFAINRASPISAPFQPQPIVFQLPAGASATTSPAQPEPSVPK